MITKMPVFWGDIQRMGIFIIKFKYVKCCCTLSNLHQPLNA
jgi:hypothetical protein